MRLHVVVCGCHPAPLAGVSPRPANGVAPGPAGLDDILGLLADPTPAAPAPPAAADPFNAAGELAAAQDIRPVGDLGQWFTRLCVRDSGVLYEDQHLQIGLKAQYSGSTGQVVLFLGNKSQQPLTRLVCAVPPLPELQVQAVAAPATLEPNQQVQVRRINDVGHVHHMHRTGCAVGDMHGGVFGASYLAAGVRGGCRTGLAEHVPAAAGGGDQVLPQAGQPGVGRGVFQPLARDCRCVMMRVASADDHAHVSGPPYKLSEAVARVTPLLPAAVQELLDGLHLAVQQGIDTEPANFVAVGTLSHGAPTAPVQVPLMLRLEVEKVQRLRFQVTVASNEVVATSAVKDVVCKLLATV